MNARFLTSFALVDCSLHAVTLTCSQFHWLEITKPPCSCMIWELPCNSMKLQKVVKFLVWAAHKNFAVLALRRFLWAAQQTLWWNSISVISILQTAICPLLYISVTCSDHPLYIPLVYMFLSLVILSKPCTFLSYVMSVPFAFLSRVILPSVHFFYM